MPQTAAQGRLGPFRAITSLPGFLGAIVATMQNWRDSQQCRLPGYRERIVRIALQPDEGGLNLNMPPDKVAAVEQAPIIRFNRQDGLNEQLFDRIFPGFPQDVPTFFVPSSEMIVTFIKEGLCYGILPEQQSRSLLESGELIDLLPGYGVKVELYWHCWNLRSELLESFSKRFIDEVRWMLKSTGADDN